MALIVNSRGDNPQYPSINAELYIPDQLIAGNLKLVTQPIVLTGSAALPRGSVLGATTDYSVITTPGASNAGNGTVGSVTATSAALLGAYTLTATSSTTFTVTNPEGTALANATVGTAYSAGGVGFTITSGGTAFAAGDTFTLTVEDSIGTYKLSVKTASDGSQTPSAILVDYADPTSGNVTTGAYVMGEFNVNAINYDSSWTLPELVTAMQSHSVFLKGSVPSAPPGTTTPTVL